MLGIICKLEGTLPGKQAEAGALTFETIIARRQGRLELTLNRPESRNAMSLAMVASRRWQARVG
jgi:hypothetical protein